MGIWTVLEEVSLRYVPVIDTGGRAVYGGLEFTARSNLDIIGIAIENHDLANPESYKWFPHLKAGFEEYAAEREDEGNPLGALRLIVTKVYSHDMDTDACTMRNAARDALRELFAKQKGGRELI